MRLIVVGVGIIFFLTAGAGIVQAQNRPATIDGLLASAKTAAGLDWPGTFLRLCIPPAPGGAAAPSGPPTREIWHAEPARVADNLYFLGTKIHNAWAIVGSGGIIILEALYDYAAADEIIGGMKKLGLDINKVKYVILSHAHADHDGGAKLLQDTIPGVHLIYGAEDWDAIDKSTSHAGGKPLRVAYVGGTAIPFNADAAYYDGYIASSRKMAKAAADFGATALMSNHTEFDNGFFKAHAAANRKSGEPNPYDVGKDAVARYFTVVQDCTTATKLRAGDRSR
jgi:metallo-beta-lactamase class B